MRFHDYLFRGVLTECPCGRHFHVPEQNLYRFHCRCGRGGGLDSRQASRLLDRLEGPARQPAVAGRRAAIGLLVSAVAAGVLGGGAGLTGPAMADGLAAADGPVILSITGSIAQHNAEDRADFDRQMLSALPPATVATSTAWTEGVVTFQGPLMRDLLAAVGAEGQTVTAIALNDYEVDIPMSDFVAYDVILAMTMDGEAMSIRDKGPLWIVYPRDDHAELQSVEYNARWIWQLRALSIE